MGRSRTSIASFCFGNAFRRLKGRRDVWKHVSDDLFTEIFVWITSKQKRPSREKVVFFVFSNKCHLLKKGHWTLYLNKI